MGPSQSLSPLGHQNPNDSLSSLYLTQIFRVPPHLHVSSPAVTNFLRSNVLFPSHALPPRLSPPPSFSLILSLPLNFSSSITFLPLPFLIWTFPFSHSASLCYRNFPSHILPSHSDAHHLSFPYLFLSLRLPHIFQILPVLSHFHTYFLSSFLNKARIIWIQPFPSLKFLCTSFSHYSLPWSASHFLSLSILTPISTKLQKSN